LTDADLQILAIARTVTEAEGQEPQRTGLQYSLENRQNYSGIPALTKERVKDALVKGVERAASSVATTKKMKGKPGGDLRKSLAVSITEVPPGLVDHSLAINNFNASTPLAKIIESDQLLDDLLKSLAQAREIMENITSTSTCKGFIIAKYFTSRLADDNAAGDDKKREGILYDDFHPFLPKKFENDPSVNIIEVDGYNKTVDEFFSSIEGQKLESRLTEREAQAKKRLDNAKQEQAKRIEGLQEAQAIHMRKAAAIEANVERVQEAMDAVNGLIAQGMDWVNIGKLVEREKKRNNPVASIIKVPLNLEENMITLNLAEEEFEEEEEADPFETDEEESEDEAPVKKKDTGEKGLLVDINLGISPWSNAREYYEQRRTAAVKEEKTQIQAVRALKNTEQKINKDLKKGLKQEKALLQPVRRQMWFEKFIWFISSDGYLIIGGKDASQNEILYRRHLRKGDIYCHADLRGASVVIVKNNPKTPDAPIPPATLSQAGTLCVCSSEAWDSKAGMGAWWVNADQVSKSIATGEFLPMGEFSIDGRKNFLPPAQLIIGLGFMFKISDGSKAQHTKHRVDQEESTYTLDSGADQGTADADAEDDEAFTYQEDAQDEAENEPDQAVPADDDQSDNGSDTGNQNGDRRENPLQWSNGAKEEDDDSGDIETGVSELQIEDKDNTAKESVKQPEADEQPSEGDQSEADGEEDDATEETSQPASYVQSKTSAAATSKQPPPKKMRKGKAKKIAKKYKHQDEDDRAAAEALIGATIGRQKAEAEAKAKAEREAELQAAIERRKVQRAKQQKQTAEHEEMRRAKMMADDGAMDDGEDEVAEAASLDSLVGMPLHGDEILEIIPVCAPWSALGKFKYKAKMQPGATKKGKAVKEILDRLKLASSKKGVVDEHSNDKERMWPREVELIKALKPEEIVNCIPVGKVRVMMAGGTGGSGGGGSGGGKGGAKGGKGGKGRGSKK
jgi:predicted ribosome quality control (RQC) complex YloA/Tae2 family protein